MKVELTYSQILEIYNAGQRSGHNSAIAFEWGSCQPDALEELENVLIWGDGILTSKDMDYDSKEMTWNLFKREIEIA